MNYDLKPGYPGGMAYTANGTMYFVKYEGDTKIDKTRKDANIFNIEPSFLNDGGWEEGIERTPEQGTGARTAI